MLADIGRYTQQPHNVRLNRNLHLEAFRPVRTISRAWVFIAKHHVIIMTHVDVILFYNISNLIFVLWTVSGSGAVSVSVTCLLMRLYRQCDHLTIEWTIGPTQSRPSPPQRLANAIVLGSKRVLLL